MPRVSSAVTSPQPLSTHAARSSEANLSEPPTAPPLPTLISLSPMESAEADKSSRIVHRPIIGTWRFMWAPAPAHKSNLLKVSPRKPESDGPTKRYKHFSAAAARGGYYVASSNHSWPSDLKMFLTSFTRVSPATWSSSGGAHHMTPISFLNFYLKELLKNTIIISRVDCQRKNQPHLQLYDLG